ncbi:NAD(P)H-dependent glycerol-3-phosphate dehydrogenase [Nitratireductor sp. GCM10026969]|uniref:NAD(P)H-dependent glycerol-3-phosphate dehydrogenase n=1 Tax=Nitratireductor sp. GCM10026969 TaxID=3252645 RepID=UPI00361BB5CC
MANILIIGAGVMGSAISVPAADNGHSVRLVGTPLDSEIIATLKKPGGVHPKLDAPLPANVEPLDIDELGTRHGDEADLLIVGVSSPGIEWVCAQLDALIGKPVPVAFVTKGLVAGRAGIRTYAQTAPEAVEALRPDLFIGIGGPCIARELANRRPTACVYACPDKARAEALARLMRTSYYRLDVSEDVTGVEACAALKNFYAIGVSAMQTRYADRGGSQTKNPTAAAFNQAIREMRLIAGEIGGRPETVFDLAGLGDLHVTVGGGRNSRLGHALGRGLRVSQVMKTELAGETVEGIDTARALGRWVRSHSEADLPLARSIVDAVLKDAPYDFDFRLVGRAPA